MIYFVLGIFLWIAANAALGLYGTPWKNDRDDSSGNIG